MFPNPQDARPVPPRPNLEQYKKQAKELVKSCKSGDPDTVRAWAAKWIETLVRLQGLKITPQMPVRVDRWIDQVAEFAVGKLAKKCALAEAQLVIARASGFESWPRLVKHIEELAHPAS